MTKFYNTPDPLPAGKPGELIRSMEFGAYDLPAEVSAVRFLYRSRSANGENVASSGVVLFPSRKPPSGGWPVIAWAHEVTGVSRQCAPSLSRNLQHGPFLSMYAAAGYAVVATDYTGLGTKFPNAYADMLSNAWDVIYSVPAARRAVSDLGSRWIAMGTGEGGRAAVAVAELENNVRDSNYLGSIAISRLTDMQDMYAPPNDPSGKSELLLAYGVKAVYPKFNVKDILSVQVLPAYDRLGQNCSEDDESIEKLSPAAVLKPDWKSNPFVQQYFARNRLGTKPAAGPLLIVGSEDDPAIGETKKTIGLLCGKGDRVQFQTYPESDPGRVIGDSVRDQMAWIQARFAGRTTPSDCGSR